MQALALGGGIFHLDLILDGMKCRLVVAVTVEEAVALLSTESLPAFPIFFCRIT